MSNIMNNECLVICKSCSTVVTATWSSNIFKKGWQLKESKGNCPTCHKPIKLGGLETAKCPHCGKLVERTADNKCLNCHKTLVRAAVRGQVECPDCGMLVDIPVDSKGDVACALCGANLSSDYISKKLAGSAVEQEQYIRLPDVAWMEDKDCAIWKHPQTTFPFKSRMQVNQGTFALLQQNGVCKEACEPGSYLLEDTELDRSQKLDAAMGNTPVVFNTDIYCVLQDLPEFNWGAAAEDLNVTFHNQGRSATYTAGSNGRVALQVCDAKAYARYLGFKSVTISELIKTDPAAGTTDSAFIQTTRDMISDALYACMSGMDGEMLERIVSNDIRDNLVMELNRRLAQNGLCVKALWINALNVKKSGDSVAADQVLGWVQSECGWNVRGARLYAYGDRNLYANMDFDGNYRLRVADEGRFFSSSEMRAFAADTEVKETTVKDYIQRKVQNALNNTLIIVAQEQIDRGTITDLLDPNQYVTTLRDRVRDRVNEDLGLDGLSLSAFTVNMPTNIVKSEALSNQQDRPQRQQEIKRAVESALPLNTDPIRVHLRDDKSVYVDLSFRGIVHLRVRDEDAFFRLSEVQGYLTSNKSLSETAIANDYAQRLNPVFAEVLSRITQSIVDQTNADVREINRFSAMLKENVRTNLAPRIEAWGLELESLDLNRIETVGTSPNLDKQGSLEQTRSGAKLDQEIWRIQNDNTIFVMEEDGRVQMRGKEIRDDIAAKDDEIALRQMERKHLYKLAELQKGSELDKLVDEIAEGKRERKGEAILEEYRREYRIREEKLNQEIREQRIAEEAQIDSTRRKQQAEFESKLNEAENKRLLNEIMHKIAESNLSWQQKLDEYDRLRKRLTAETQTEIRQMEADTDLKILRDKTEYYIDVAGKKIQLSAAEAELMERINRYNEDRREREAQANENRLERRATLDFERRMQDRREQVAQKIDELKIQYEHELAMRDRDLDLQKLTAELQYHTAAIEHGADVQKTQANADAAARIAEAEAAVKRMEEQLKREEDIAKRAEEFKKALLEIQAALELTRLGNERNRDDRTAEVGIATAQAAGKSDGQQKPAGMTNKEQERLRDVEKKIDRILNSVKDLRKRVNVLEGLIKPWPPTGPRDPWTPQPPHYSISKAPVTSPIAPEPVTPTPQPGTTSQPARQCPICKTPIAEGTTICPICGNPIL